MNSYSRTYVTVDLDAIAYNFESMRKNIREGTQILAVIKADAYGHGAVTVGKFLDTFSYIWGFATATAEEALELRDAGIQKPILVLGYVFEEHYEELLEKEVRMPVFDLETAEKIASYAEQIHKKAKIHIALDTGMNRIGFKDTQKSAAVICKISQMAYLQIEGMFTHFARADETDKIYADRQFRRYMDFHKQLQDWGVTIPVCHCSNSAGIIDMPYANLDVVRAGITIYGIYPSDEVQKEKVPLKPVMSWKSGVAFVKEVETAINEGVKPITLGRRILRTETAGLAILSVLMFQLENQ